MHNPLEFTTKEHDFQAGTFSLVTSGECRNPAALWPFAATAVLKPVLKDTSDSQGLQGYK